MVPDSFTYIMTLEPCLLLHDFACFFVRSAGRWSDNSWLGAGSSASSLTLQFVLPGLGGVVGLGRSTLRNAQAFLITKYSFLRLHTIETDREHVRNPNAKGFLPSRTLDQGRSQQAHRGAT